MLQTYAMREKPAQRAQAAERPRAISEELLITSLLVCS
jgi:hypothetical protein